MTHYEVLRVEPTAPIAEVRRAYVALARQHHPDRANGDADSMRAINDAWATLRDPDRRAAYDVSLGRARLTAAPAETRPASAPAETRPVSDLDDLLADLEDDTPVGGQVVLPRWLSLLPVATFAASVATVVAGMLFSSSAALSLGFLLFVLSCAMFLMAPFVALLASRRRG